MGDPCLWFFYLFFQKEGKKTRSRAKNSSRPKSIQKMETAFDQWDISAHHSAGSSPALFVMLAMIWKAFWKLSPSRINKNVPKTTVNIITATRYTRSPVEAECTLYRYPHTSREPNKSKPLSKFCGYRLIPKFFFVGIVTCCYSLFGLPRSRTCVTSF